MNKSQGQKISNRMLLDVSAESFAHDGHLYVALSRITAFYNIMFFCQTSQLSDDKLGVVVQNIVFRDLFKSFPISM
jgi:hypothetical protein